MLTDDVGVVELRQYTLRPGRRDALVELFERHFIEPQEELGARILGHFRDLDDPDRFVWLRGFRDMETRREALEAFYESPAWLAHADAANATMVAWDDVRLLRPAPGFQAAGAASRVRARNGGAVGAIVWPLPGPAAGELDPTLAAELPALLARNGTPPSALLVTEPRANTYPRLPVREGENVLVALAHVDDPADLETVAMGADDLGPPLQTLRLAPAPRSRCA